MQTSIVVAAILPFLFINADQLHARQVALGVKGGIRTMGDTNSSPPSESKLYRGSNGGHSIAVSLGSGVRRTRPFAFTGGAASVVGSSIARARANSWEFPIVAKYRLPGLLAHPFVSVDYAPRVVHGADVSSGSFLSGEATKPPADMLYDIHGSPVAYAVSRHVRAGFLWRLGFQDGHLRFSPELRYVHRNRPFLDRVSGDGSFSCTQRRMRCSSYSASRGTDIYRFFSVTPTP